MDHLISFKMLSLLAIACLVLSSLAANFSTEWSQFSHLVSIRDRTGHLCSGTLIGSRALLTAASCVYDKPVSTLKVSNSDGTSRTVRNVTVLPTFNKTKSCQTDLAAVFLNYPINLPLVNKYFKVNKTKINNTLIYPELDPKSKTVNIVNVTVKYPINCLNSSNLICAQFNKYSSSCNCDYGGPVVDLKSDTLVGVLGKRDRECQFGEFWGVVELEGYMEWIKKMEGAHSWTKGVFKWG